MTDDAPAVLSRAELTTEHVLLDVREDDEWAAGHAPQAVHVPIGSVPAHMTYDPGPLLSDLPIVVTCKGGGRAGKVARWLNANGFDAVVLSGGMLGWQADGRPMDSESGSVPTVL